MIEQFVIYLSKLISPGIVSFSTWQSSLKPVLNSTMDEKGSNYVAINENVSFKITSKNK